LALVVQAVQELVLVVQQLMEALQHFQQSHLPVAVAAAEQMTVLQLVTAVQVVQAVVEEEILQVEAVQVTHHQ
tara:strand:+ start:93 stop:311 length:219 start_codon:yes stop_codon:yes gene_type:complete